MLRIEDLTVWYPSRSTPILNRLSLRIESGECVAIVGPSGCGKTTLFRAIGGFVPIKSGRIAVDGIDVGSTQGNRLRELRQRVGIIAQKHDLVDRLSVCQNVMAGALGRWSGFRALRFLLLPLQSELREARDALERVGIPHELHSRTSDLSGGQQQRAAIARALVQNPSLLLADEPVASLNPELAGQILALLCELAAKERLALLCSLHQPELARRYFHRVVDIGPAHVRRSSPTATEQRKVIVAREQ